MTHRIRFMTVIAAALLAASPALALDLQGARSSGLVGEKPNGYVEAVKPSPDVLSLVGDVNAKRKEEYARISKENGQSVEVVGQLAAQQIISKLPAGSLYQGSDGSWKKR
jgi:uncharacterized protein YdbL (DUF1318 family)